jgi:hypothetical protein
MADDSVGMVRKSMGASYRQRSTKLRKLYRSELYAPLTVTTLHRPEVQIGNSGLIVKPWLLLVDVLRAHNGGTVCST